MLQNDPNQVWLQHVMQFFLRFAPQLCEIELGDECLEYSRVTMVLMKTC